MQPRRRLQVLDLVRTGETTEDAVEYARQSTFTNAAEVVVEATATTTGTKPEATIAFTKETAAVADYAVWVPATRRSLSDVDSLRDAVDGQLTFAVRRKLEEAVVAAMVADAGATQAKGADTLAIAALKLLTTLRSADVEPTAALLNPADYEALRSMTTAYTSPPVTVGDDGVERLFGVPLVVSASVPDDTALIADMQSVAVWLRSLNVYISASHSRLLRPQSGRDPGRPEGGIGGRGAGGRRKGHRMGLSALFAGDARSARPRRRARGGARAAACRASSSRAGTFSARTLWAGQSSRARRERCRRAGSS